MSRVTSAPKVNAIARIQSLSKGFVPDVRPTLTRRSRIICIEGTVGLDCVEELENDLVVVDDRVPGDSKPEMHLYECEKCHRTEWSEAEPECHGRKMSLIQ